jgi:hypothetical protein
VYLGLHFLCGSVKESWLMEGKWVYEQENKGAHRGR